MPTNVDDDEYIANLLKQDAKNAKKKYELVGIDAFNPKRLNSGAPKPNTNFLRHIIRQTDSHNAALLAREAEESNARLKQMNHERIRAQTNEELRKERKAEGRLTPVLSEEEVRIAPRRRDDPRSSRGDSRHRRRERSSDSRSRRYRSRSREPRRDKRKREDSEDERSNQRPKHSKRQRDRRHREDYSSDEEEEERSRRKHKSSRRHRRRRYSSHSSSESRSPSSDYDRAERKRRRRDRSRSRSPKRPARHHKHERATQSLYKSGKSKRRSPSPSSESDPLEAIVGPLPPNVQPSVRSRGRGAHKANSMGMDSRFSATYDPAVDVRPPSDAEDDWGQSVEAFRDRQRWKQQGAERLKAAGFTDEQVKKWEKGDSKDEEDVRWTKRGQAREWDRGKVVDEDGDVELKAEWGRLK